MSFFKKPYVYAITFGLILTVVTVYSLLDAFIIPHVLIADETSISSNHTSSSSDSTLIPLEDLSSQAIINDDSYSDGNISITINEIRTNNTSVYVAEVTLADASLIKTALANNTYGTNITQKTSAMASTNNAILAINGDYYGANNTGYVIKNGTLYRSSIRSDSEYDDLVLYSDGTFRIINEKEISAQQLISDGVSQLFAFGPTLIENGSIAVNSNSEVGQSMSSNPRSAIGIIDSTHFIFVVSDGRTNASTGLSLYQLAQVMEKYNCQTAYNLDGGGSSTMYFNGRIVNNPTTNGKSISERAVSDIVYIGY